MRLRTFESFWLLKNGLKYCYPSLQHSLDAEIIVIGGGITGALTAHALMDEGYDVLLLDKRDIGQGSTAATTSMLQYEIDVSLYQLSEMIGEDNASLAYRSGIKALKKLDELISHTKIDCSYESKQSVYMAHNKKALTDLRNEFLIREKHHLDVMWLNEKDLASNYGLVSPGAILSEHAASVDAYAMAHELIAFNVKRGLKVYDQVEIDEIQTGDPAPWIRLKNGAMATAKKLIFCTGFESTKMLKESIADLFYTYACISEQNCLFPPALQKTLVWDTADPYLYMRSTPDNRLLIGGEDSSNNIPFFQQKIKERKSLQLISKLEKILPGIHFTEDFSWGGTFGSTKDGLPYIGKSPEHEHALFVLGFGGNGITFSIQAMEIIPTLLKGESHPLAGLYKFGR
ncbi:MAG: FAD-dependent oxidoreductase [Chitinophagaceae bacterium]